MKGKIVSFIVGLVLALGIFEGSLRVVGYFSQNSQNKIVDKTKKRIVNLGNSYTAGAGASYGNSYSDYLQFFLDKKGKDYQVINRGVSNANTSYLRGFFEEWLDKDQPTQVFIMIGEPNHWNKYGYWKFLEDRYRQKSFFNNFEFFRSLKTARFFEFLINTSSATSKKSDGYSLVFKSVPLEKKDLLGYTWIGALQSNFTFYNALTYAQKKEALKAVEYIYAKDSNPLAAILAAKLCMETEGKLDEAFDYLTKASILISGFDYGLYQAIWSFHIRYGLYGKKFLELEEKEHAKLGDVKIEELNNWFFHQGKLKKMTKNERIAFLHRMHLFYPADSKTIQFLLSEAYDTNPEMVLEAIKRNLKLNPISPAHDLLLSTQEMGRKYPQVKHHVKEIMDDVSKRISDISIDKIHLENKLEEEWIISDLESIIQMAQDRGVQVVVQTYPPVRDGNERFADEVLRRWWANNKNKKDVVFMDLGEMLTDKFSLQNGGERFYSTMFGDKDNHQSAEGNYEIAKLMVDYVK